MSYDVKMFVLCNHYVDGEFYQSNKCPRCLGNNLYFDLYIDDAGITQVVDGEVKLQQELLKISIEEKGGNIFHTNWGSDLKRQLIGSKHNNAIRQKAEIMVRNSMEYLRSLQEGEQLVYQHMDPEEMLSSVESVDVVATSQVSFDISVVVRTKYNRLISFNYSVE